MVTLQEVERQLDLLGANSKFWGRAEIVELQHILVPGEQIKACLVGRYSGGFAIFVTTDQRLLLVDKKLFFLTVEDMRYDMIAEVDFSAQLMSGTMRVCTPTKNLSFTSYQPKKLRQAVMEIQQTVMQVRHQYSADPGQAPVAPVAQPFQPPVSRLPAINPNPAVQPFETLLGIGQQSINGANAQPDLRVPQRRNPYMNPPLMIRKRIGRFGSIGVPTQNNLP